MTVHQNEIEIKDWTARGAGLYRFYGSEQTTGGFYCDARLEYRGEWCATIESTNYTGDSARLADFIAAFAESM
jgi:hypothetical protein